MKKGNNSSSGYCTGVEIEDYLLTATEKEAAKMERPLGKNWFSFFWWLVVIFMLIIFARIIFINVIKGSYYREISKGNSVRSLVIKAPRGRIFDKFGSVLVNNVPSVDISAIPIDLPFDSDKRKSEAEALAKILEINSGDIIAKFSAVDYASLNPILLKENITQNQSLILTEQLENFPGIRIEKSAIRQYVSSNIFAHILGYEGKIEKKEFDSNKGYLLTDYIGKQGIEKSYEQYLRGVHGANQIEVDSMGNSKREVGIINPKPGSDLYLGVDAALQEKLYKSLTAILEKTQTKIATAVAINPKNGEILAFVNIPSYDNNLFANKISQGDYTKLISDPDKPLFNRAITGEYPPGSTIKPALAAGALTEGTITPSTIIDGLGGVLNIGNFAYHDWKAHGPSDVRTAISESNDIFFYTIGGGYGNITGLGMDRMKKYYNLFGFGSPTGIDIGGEASGLIPSEQWKLDNIKEKWYIGNSYHAAIGQGYVTATPLQIANYTAAVANGGTLYKPHFVSEIKKSDGEIVKIKPEIIRSNFISPDIMKVIREGMRKTVTSGTAQPLNVGMPIEVAGKTGTAQFGSEDKTHGWFISFAPFNNPEIAMAILVEGGGEGYTSGVPVTKEIYQWYFGGRK
jgi:penicillin-binding protein 2